MLYICTWVDLNEHGGGTCSVKLYYICTWVDFNEHGGGTKDKQGSGDDHGPSALIGSVIGLCDIVDHKDVCHPDLINWTVWEDFDNLIGAYTMSFQFGSFRMSIHCAIL